MKVLLTMPPVRERAISRAGRFQSIPYATPVMHPPLLMAYAAAYLRERGHTVTIIDAQVEPMTVADFVSAVKAFSPDFLVVETTTPSFNSDVSVAREAKEATGCHVVFMGSHVSAMPEEAVKDGVPEAVVMGEYEATLAEYVEKGPLGTKGICYWDNGKAIVNPPREFIQDLSAMPFPARDLLHNDRYFDPILANPFTFVLGGRGCPFRCTFCNWPQTLSGRKYRVRSPENIVDELEQLEKQYKFASYLFNDDTFTANRDHAISICRLIQSRGLKIKWACYSRADNVDEEMLLAMREAGCFLLKTGVESGNQAIINRCNKNYKMENVQRGIKLMMRLGFNVHSTFVFGLPGENLQTIKETVAFAKKLSPTTVQFSTAVPLPGTELYDYLKSQGFLVTNSWDDYLALHPIFQYPDLTTEQLMGSVKKAYRSYYFRPYYVKVGVRELFRRPREVMRSFMRLVRFSY